MAFKMQKLTNPIHNLLNKHLEQLRYLIKIHTYTAVWLKHIQYNLEQLFVSTSLKQLFDESSIHYAQLTEICKEKYKTDDVPAYCTLAVGRPFRDT